MAQTEFGVKYDGPALSDHTMDVRDLAPSLLALGEMFTTASRLLHPDRDPVSMSIKATPEGSFAVVLMLQADGLWDHVVNIFNGDTVNSLINLQNLLIGGGSGVGGGVLWAIRKFHGKKLKKRESVAPGRTRVEWEDGTVVEVDDDMLRLYESMEMRKVTRKFVEPLRRDGIDKIGFLSEEVVTVTVRHGDLPAYDVPEPTEVRTTHEVERTLTIVSPVFKDGNKWLVSDGSNGTFYASILDDNFRARVQANWERFGHGDMLRCVVREIQTRRGTVLGTEREILKVTEHITADTQIPLGSDGSEADTPAA